MSDERTVNIAKNVELCKGSGFFIEQPVIQVGKLKFYKLGYKDESLVKKTNLFKGVDKQ